MKDVSLELYIECPSGNQVKNMNHLVYRRMLESLKKEILEQIGEGPWPKITFGREHSPAIRRQVRDELKKCWAPKNAVTVDVTIRRPSPIDVRNSLEGLKIVWDALNRMGWMVDHHRKWLDVVHRDQVVGDHKVILTVRFK